MERKGWITKFTALRFFLGGIEIYIVAPTAWYYIRSLGQTKFFLALVFTAYNIGAIIAGPLFGFLTDRFGNPRFMFTSCCAIKVIASMIYSVNLSAYFPLFGRLMTGLSGDIAILLGQVALQTDEKYRAASFVFLEGLYCLGAVFGPTIGGFITFRANLFGWEIDEGNSPGIVLAILYLFFLIASLLLPKEIWVQSKTQSKTQSSIASDVDYEDDASLLDYQDENQTFEAQIPNQKLNNLLDSRVLCLFFLIFSSEVFSSTATFYAPILALDHFYLKEIHVKLLFLNCTLFTLLLFFCLHLVSKYVEERNLFSFALFMEIIAMLFLALLAFSWNQVTDVQWYFVLLYICLGMPYFANPFGNSILSKITDPKNATLVQGISLATVHTAIASCRVAVSFAFTKASLICYCFGMVIL